MSVVTESYRFVNTSWMMSGQACWVPINDTIKLRTPVANPPLYIRGHIQRLNPTRTKAILLYLDHYKGPEEIEVRFLIKANNDYDKFPEGWADIVQMNLINDAELIANIKLRFQTQNFYTYFDK